MKGINVWGAPLLSLVLLLAFLGIWQAGTMPETALCAGHRPARRASDADLAPRLYVPAIRR